MRFVSIVFLTWSLSLSQASAQGYPAKPLLLIVPYAPGAAYDLVGRIIAEGARPSLGTIVVENRPGGSGGIAAAQVKRVIKGAGIKSVD